MTNTPPNKSSKNSKETFFICLVSGVVIGILFLVQTIWCPGNQISGMYIPDSQIYVLWFEDLSTNNLLFNIFSGLKTMSIGVQIFYYPFWALSPKILFIPNLIFLGSIFILCYRVFNPLGSKSAFFSCLSLVCLPYTVLAIMGPNKELPLIFFTLAFFFKPIQKKFIIYHLLIVFLTFLIRDGYGIGLLLWWLIKILTSKTRFRKIGRYAWVLPIFSIFFFDTLSYFVPPVQRIASVAKQLETTEDIKIDPNVGDNAGTFFSLIDFGRRATTNLLSLFLRPTIIDSDNNLSILGIGYWILGYFLILISLGIVFGIMNNLLTNQLADELFWFILYMFMIINVTPFAHPRYLIPLLPIGFAIYVNPKNSIRLWLPSLVIFLFVVLFVISWILNLPLVKFIEYSAKNEIRPAFFF